jgi:LuxR family transcriptional regulator, maltose regulon positive regulatory protein
VDERTLFLRTKLLPPRPAPTLLSRPRLVERLRANLACPVTLVTANAGSGKTTLVADFVRTQTCPFVWYQLDHTDADPSVFLGYLAQGFRQHFPEFGQAFFAYLQQATEFSQHPERAVDVLLNEVLERAEQQLILVLDDYHHLGAETAVHRIMDRLIAYLPDVLHLLLISREMPPLQLSRLRAQTQLAIIDRRELLFNDEEIQTLFREVFQLELTPQQLHEYRERTQGWITALQLVRQVAHQQTTASDAGPDKPDLAEVLRQSERDIFGYFAEEVFAAEPEPVRRLLLQLSLLDRIELEACARLFPEAGCAALLPELVRRNVFLTVAADKNSEEYRLHPLFQDFLRRRLREEVGHAGVMGLQLFYADYYLSKAQWEQALEHLLAAEEYDRAAQLIAERGPAWIAAGALELLTKFTDALPEAVLEGHPRALAHKAEALRLRGEYEAAQVLLRQATTLLSAQQDRTGEAEALHSLATIARRQNDFTLAFAYLDHALNLGTDDSAIQIKCGNTRGLCLMALGKCAEAEHEFRLAFQAAETAGNQHYTRLLTHNLGLPAMVRGDFGEALRWLRRMLHDEQASKPLPQEATAHLNVARCLLYRGELDECEQHLEQALKRCQLFNLPAVRAEIFETYGNFYRERQEITRAAEFYARAARTYEEAGIELSQRELLEEQALLRLQTGDLTGAHALLDRLIEARQARKDKMGLHTATLALSRILLAQRQRETASAELEAALHYFCQHALYYYEAQACLLLAACKQIEGDEGQMLECLRRTAELTARYDYDYWLGREVATYPQLFVKSEAAELLPPDIREKLAALPAPPTAPAPALPEIIAPPVDLTIRLLGPVEIFRDPQRPLAAEAWTTRRARDILCFLASRRHHRASKDILIDTFWGEADLEAVARNFHPTISHIRMALNSNQPIKQNFLLYREGDYLLNAEFTYYIDTEEFDRLVAEGEAARRRGNQDHALALYEEAIQLYRGEFMQGTYDEWVEEQRSYYREQYLQLLEALVMAAQKSAEWLRALQLAQQVLREDPFREDIHCVVMRAHAAQGNRSAVKEQYETLRKLLRSELAVEPALETQKLYRQLFG